VQVLLNGILPTVPCCEPCLSIEQPLIHLVEQLTVRTANSLWSVSLDMPWLLQSYKSTGSATKSIRTYQCTSSTEPILRYTQRRRNQEQRRESHSTFWVHGVPSRKPLVRIPNDFSAVALYQSNRASMRLKYPTPFGSPKQWVARLSRKSQGRNKTLVL
jgi:hypothetical protein